MSLPKENVNSFVATAGKLQVKGIVDYQLSTKAANSNSTSLEESEPAINNANQQKVDKSVKINNKNNLHPDSSIPIEGNNESSFCQRKVTEFIAKRMNG